MSAPQFTPGPWQSKHDYTIEGATTIIANVDGELFSDGTTSHTFDFICTCEDEFGERLPNAQANARLIRAAPELYAALNMIRHNWAGHAEICAFVTSGYRAKCDCDFPKVAAQCDAALAKAVQS